jgi:hypothetical protein
MPNMDKAINVKMIGNVFFMGAIDFLKIKKIPWLLPRD